jgi:hypothetical protein
MLNRFPVRKLLLCAVALNAALAPMLFSLHASNAQPADPPPGWYVWRVAVTSEDEVTRLTSGRWDVLEARGPDYLLVLGEQTVADQLRAEGFAVTMDSALPAPVEAPLTYYGGYRTVAEHFQHLTSIATAYPSLAKVVDYGDSWGKLNAGPVQNDLRALCLTLQRAGDCALNPNTDKPRFLLMAAIHARELSTAEMAWRWIDYLVTNYGSNAEVKALLDYNELWVIPVVNPDGRVKVEQGGNNPYTQRKNLNTSAGACSEPPTGSSQFGVDLNRNANFQWGGAGTSTFACDLVYRGVSAASEPEQSTLEALFRNLYRDQRGPALTDSAPITTTGAMLTLHTYSNLVLLPWSWTQCSFGVVCPANLRAPNDAALRSMAFRLSHFNGYNTGQGSEILYAASGTTDDQAYGDLGIAGFTFEIGPTSGTCGGFIPPYACQDSTFWPLNRDAFVYAAKAARQPYALSLGPTPISPTVSPSGGLPGTVVTFTVTLRDDAYSNVGFGRPAAQNIVAAELYVDVPWWAGGTPLPMTAQDGAFDSPNEIVRATVNTTGWTPGNHTLFVRGQDAAGNWGVFGATFVYVDVPQWGVQMSPSALSGVTTTAGQTLTYTLTLTNSGAFSDIYTLSLSGNQWPTSAPLTVARVSQQSGPFTVTVTIPLTATLGTRDVVTVTAQSTGENGLTAASVITTALAHPLYLPLIQR